MNQLTELLAQPEKDLIEQQEAENKPMKILIFTVLIYVITYDGNCNWSFFN